MRQNEHQVAEAREMASRLGVDDIVFKKVDFPHGEDNPAVAERWLPAATDGFLREQPFDKPYRENGQRCWRLWRSGVVNWDGGYAPCCYLTDQKDDFGDLKTQRVKEIWNNRYYIAARSLFKDGPLPATQVGCLTCNVYLESNAGRKRGPAIHIQTTGHESPGRLDPERTATLSTTSNKEKANVKADG
jgi:hypothetical protein